MNIYEKLVSIQTEMKAPKNLENTFGNYKYRNAEGILEAFKPFAKEYNVVLFLTDSVVEIGGRFYIKADATIQDAESEQAITVSAFAREEETKRGMDGAQVTGSASSYARKYALNGLLAIDDAKDPDSDEYHKQTNQDAKKLSKKQEEYAMNLINQKNIPLIKVLDRYHVDSLSDILAEQYDGLVKALKATE